MRIDEIMSRHVRGIDADLDADDAWHYMQENNVRHLVVMHDEHVVGMLSQSALGGVHGLRRFPGMPTPRVRELMEPHLFAVEPDTDVRDVAKVLRDLSLDAMPVMVGGLLLGIVTRSDLLDVVAAG